jgi:hypothetical protein
MAMPKATASSAPTVMMANSRRSMMMKRARPGSSVVAHVVDEQARQVEQPRNQVTTNTT